GQRTGSRPLKAGPRRESPPETAARERIATGANFRSALIVLRYSVLCGSGVIRGGGTACGRGASGLSRPGCPFVTSAWTRTRGGDGKLESEVSTGSAGSSPV